MTRGADQLVYAFDLGDTLLEYEGLPLSWEMHYPDALAALAEDAGILPTPEQIAAGCAALKRFNTRLHPREIEVKFDEVLTVLWNSLGALNTRNPNEPTKDTLGCARAFFQVFRQRLRCFPDTVPTLEALRQRGQRIAVFTDVPYGMPRELVLEDIAVAGLAAHIDILVTSGDVGFRKPSARVIPVLAAALGCEIGSLAYVGNETKDIAIARAAGCIGIALCRGGSVPAWGQHRTISLLSDLLSG